MSIGSPIDSPYLSASWPLSGNRTSDRPVLNSVIRDSCTSPQAGAEISRRPRLASVLMGDTRPLPQQSAPGQPGQPGPRARRPRPGRLRRYLKRAAISLAAVIVVLAIAAGALWIATPSASEATQLAKALADQRGIAYPGPDVPENFSRPLVATEDHRFYSEPGVDLLAVGRVVQAKVAGGSDQGGATIEQQLAKMLYTPAQAGFGTEVKQVVLAVKLNIAYSKQQILDLYAEVAYYGHGFYGLEQASCGYFGHPAKDLTVVQGAMLAGVVNAPSVDDPINDPASAKARLEHVIARMVAVGYLSQAQGQQALKTPLGLTTGASGNC
jgi:membrane peptidoglycan carboxypeptidase